jgi:hypothetical protein
MKREQSCKNTALTKPAGAEKPPVQGTDLPVSEISVPEFSGELDEDQDRRR